VKTPFKQVSLVAVATTILASADSPSTLVSDLAEPTRLEANGIPIDMTQGNAAPYVVDFDGDGKHDLLLGQRGECKLRIYRNLGDNTQPKLGPSAWFKAGGVDASLPGG
jgi:hypothetical protein